MSTAENSRPDDLAPAPAGGDGVAIWLDGDVLACACPECGAPMSIRIWLMVADCWRCGVSLELTEEQEREAQRLLQEREKGPRGDKAAVAPAKPAAAPASKVFKPAPKPQVAPRAAPLALPHAEATAVAAKPQAAAVMPQRRLASDRATLVKARLKDVQDLGPLDIWWRAMYRDLPAWIASLVVHMVMLIVLALWTVDKDKDLAKSVTLVISTQTNDLHREGGRKGEQPEPDPIEFEKPGKDDKKDDKIDEPEPVRVEPEVEKPMPDKPPGKPLGNQPGPFSDAGAAPNAGKALFSGRTSTARAELVQQEGGTTVTEAAVGRGLHWLVQHQNSNGSWSLDTYHKAGECKGRCGGGGFNSDVAGTGLALLPFLGAGQSHLQGKYSDEVRRGLEWLIKRQEPDGDFPSPVRNSHMYAHGLASIAMCEAFALTQDEWLRDPAQRAVNFIVNAQHRKGGWRYQPGEPGDTSVVGWQLMALRSAQLGYLTVPPEVFKNATAYLDSCQSTSLGDRYAYMPGAGQSHVMTAEALLCRQYSGWTQDHPGLMAGVQHLVDDHLPRGGREVNMYYWYYATQVMHHMGGEAWENWNFQMRDLLVGMQETKGHLAGSWSPRSGHDAAGGRVYMTALAVCTLEVYYRHLPLYRAMAVEK